MNMFVNFFSLAIAFILIWWISSDFMLNQHRKKHFQGCLILIIIVILAELGCFVFDNSHQQYRNLSIICNVIGFGVSPFVFLVESKCYDSKASKHFIQYVPAFIQAGIVSLSPFTGWIFYVNEANQYQRGNLYLIYIAVFTYSVVYSGIRKLSVANHLPSYFRKRIINSEIILGAGLLLQVFIPDYHTTWLIVTICMIFFYAFSCQLDSILDGLTSLLNRSAFNRCLDYLKPETETTLFMFDVNHFKMINDTCGHAYGDICLQKVASILKHNADFNTQVFRYGGDEFCALMASKSDLSIENYCQAIEKEICNEQLNDECFPGVAIGFAKFDKDKNKAQLINEADEMMYRNKKKNRK